jgi:hypothetical protein
VVFKLLYQINLKDCLLLSLTNSESDEEIIAIVKPILDNLVKISNMKDYDIFTKYFEIQML